VRENKVLQEGDIFDFKISKWDRRYAWIKNPITNDIEELVAYEYTKDKRIQRLLEESLGNRDIAPFVLTQKLVNYSEKILKEISTPDGGVNLLLSAVAEEFKKKGKLRKRTRKLVNLFFREARKDPKRIEAVLKALSGERITINHLNKAGIEIENENISELSSETKLVLLEETEIISDFVTDKKEAELEELFTDFMPGKAAEREEDRTKDLFTDFVPKLQTISQYPSRDVLTEDMKKD